MVGSALGTSIKRRGERDDAAWNKRVVVLTTFMATQVNEEGQGDLLQNIGSCDRVSHQTKISMKIEPLLNLISFLKRSTPDPPCKSSP
jgi:hypothetical protein